MYNTAHFSRMPRTELPATRMKKPQIVAGTSLHGEIIPLFCNLVMPGQVDSNIMNGAIWMSSPIAPIMSQIKASVNVFFVPLRLVFDKTREFFGENTTSSGPRTTVQALPAARINDPNNAGSKVGVGSVSHYLGKPLFKGATLDDGSNVIGVSPLKERAYWLIWSEYYRHQQVENPFIINTGANGSIGTLNGTTINFASMPAVCLKDYDYFTTATISPNYGGEVLLPLGSVAPVIGVNSSGTKIYDKFQMMTDDDLSTGYVAFEGRSTSTFAQMKIRDNGTASNSSSGMADSSAQLFADLSQATSAKIDDLYTAMAAQAFYHNCNYGSRYFEQIQIHYGVTNPDLVLDRPEHVSEFKFDIVVQDVVSSAGAANDATTKLGQPGAYSKTLIRKKLYNHSFGEWGFVIALMNTYHQRYYSAGIPREDLYSELFDFYFPEFACRGDDYIFEDELFLATSRAAKQPFGYQEAYADRRYYPSRSTGQLDAYCDASVNGKNPIGRWILDEKWLSAPTLSASFLKENRAALSDALVSGSSGPDFIWQFNFEHTELLPMPAYSKPGIPTFGRGIV